MTWKIEWLPKEFIFRSHAQSVGWIKRMSSSTSFICQISVSASKAWSNCIKNAVTNKNTSLPNRIRYFLLFCYAFATCRNVFRNIITWSCLDYVMYKKYIFCNFPPNIIQWWIFFFWCVKFFSEHIIFSWDFFW